MDWDNDGRKDLVLGGYFGYVKVYRNTGTDVAPVFNGFTYVKVNATDFDCGSYSAPDVVDWNGDGKKDLLVGEETGVINLLLNTSTGSVPAFAAQVLIQSAGTNLNAGSCSHPVAVDWNRDGKKDLLVGNAAGSVLFYRNVGTDNAPVFNGYEFLVAGGTTIDVGSYSRPEIADWNDDGYADLLVGAADGMVRVFSAIPLVKVDIPAATEGNGILSNHGSVSILSPAPSNIVVTLNSLDTSELTVPSSATITTGSTNARFNVTIADDAILDGSQFPIVTAAAGLSLGTHKSRARVNDNESTTLTVTIPASAREGDGELSRKGTVFLGLAPDADILVTLTSDDTTELTTDESITVPSGQVNAVFDLKVVDDVQIDYAQTVTVTAHIENWTDGAATITINDNENTNLVVAIPSLAGEGDGALSGAGTITISGTLPSALVVSLASADTSELTVPSTVTINSGNTSVYFNVTVMDDAASDGQQSVSVTASSAGLASGSDSIVVADDEIDHFTFGSINSNQLASVPFGATITARDINNALAWYQGTAALTAAGNSGVAPVRPSMAAFSNGTWSGSVQVDKADTGIRILASDGSSHTGTSTVFNTAIGVVKSFRWEPIPAIQYKDVPFPVQISARDANNYLVTGFSGTVDILGYVASSTSNSLRTTGTGVSINIQTLPSWYHDSRTQAIYLHSELGSAGLLDSIALNIYNSNLPVGKLKNWTIRVKHTDLDFYSSSASWETNGWTTVYKTDLTVSSAGWLEFKLSTPFLYNGTDNLMIDFSFNNSASLQYVYNYHSIAPTNRSIYYRCNSTAGDPLNWSGSSPAPVKSVLVPNLKLNIRPLLEISPSVSGSFSNGKWDGSMTCLEGATNIVMMAMNGYSLGYSVAFDVLPAAPVTIIHSVPHSWLASQDPSWTNDAETTIMLDPDGDGFSTWQEYWSGTDPQAAESCLKIDRVFMAGNSIRIEWQHDNPAPAIPPIAIYASSNLITGPWFFAGEIDPSDGTNTWQQPASHQLFYRLVVTNAP